MPTETSTLTSSQRVLYQWRFCPLRRENINHTTPLYQVTLVRLYMESEFTPPVFHKTTADRAVIRKNICGHFAFKDASEEETEQLIDAFERHEAKEGGEVIRQGSVRGVLPLHDWSCFVHLHCQRLTGWFHRFWTPLWWAGDPLKMSTSGVGLRQVSLRSMEDPLDHIPGYLGIKLSQGGYFFAE